MFNTNFFLDKVVTRSILHLALHYLNVSLLSQCHRLNLKPVTCQKVTKKSYVKMRNGASSSVLPSHFLKYTSQNSLKEN